MARDFIMLSGHFFRALRALQKLQLIVWLANTMVSVVLVYKMSLSYISLA